MSSSGTTLDWLWQTNVKLASLLDLDRATDLQVMTIKGSDIQVIPEVREIP